MQSQRHPTPSFMLRKYSRPNFCLHMHLTLLITEKLRSRLTNYIASEYLH
jgi:hypothetical protein